MGKAGSPSVLVLYPEYTGSFQNIFISPPEHSLWFVIAPSKWASAYNAGDPSLIPGSGRSAGEGIAYMLQEGGPLPGPETGLLSNTRK